MFNESAPAFAVSSGAWISLLSDSLCQKVKIEINYEILENMLYHLFYFCTNSTYIVGWAGGY